jgi:sporulation protein YunB
VRVRLRGPTILKLAAVAVAVGLLCIGLDARAKPQIHALASTAARQQASTAITQAVERVLTEEQVSYERLVALSSPSDEGGIRSIETNALEVNMLRGKINAAAEEAVALRNAKLRLPMGALLGSDLFAGAGPKLSVPLTMTGHALSDIRSDLTSSGVNQTMHRILMDLHVTLSVILPGEIITTEVSVTVCLAETVIVGAVPDGIMSYGSK